MIDDRPHQNMPVKYKLWFLVTAAIFFIPLISTTITKQGDELLLVAVGITVISMAILYLRLHKLSKYVNFDDSR